LQVVFSMAPDEGLISSQNCKNCFLFSYFKFL
jgi:hypothetical protein